MGFPDEKRRVPILFVTGLFAVAFFLAGCAETSSTAGSHRDPASPAPDSNQRMVVGQGTAEDRTVIDATDQRIFDAEHAGSPASGQPAGGNAQ